MGIKICAVSGSRADFGYMLPLLEKLEEDPFFQLDFTVTASHLAGGKPDTELLESPIPIGGRVPLRGMEDNTPQGIAVQIGEAVSEFARYFTRHRPEMLISIGDRYEMFAAVTAAYTMRIPVSHISGGSVTAGALDEAYRHAITKMSALHFATCEVYRKRIIQLGESPDSVYNVGSLAIENCLKAEIPSETALRKDVGLPDGQPYCVVTFHPATLDRQTPEQELRELIHALDRFPEYRYLITLSNTDAGGSKINALWRSAGEKRPYFRIVPSLGMKRYLAALKYAEMMIGNSSSGTTEGPAMKIPVVDIGDRQKGRVFSDCLIHCDPEADAIERAIRRAASPAFREIARNVKNPFGDGNSSEKICRILRERLADGVPDLKKTFYDIPIIKSL